MKKKVCFVATLEMSVKVFLTDHMRLLQEFFDLSVAVNTENPAFLLTYGVRANVIPVGLRRRISLVRDFQTFLIFYRLFKRERFDIIHSIMPKSGLLAMAAGFFARVPVRVHTFTGQVWKNSRGLKRFVLKTMDRIVVRCATHILVDSLSQREFLARERVVSLKKSSVIGDGSICGVDTQRFRLDKEARDHIRGDHSIAPDDIVFCFLGRMKRDKGVLDLARAFSALCSRSDRVHLLIAGPDEDNISDEVARICAHCSDRVHIVGYADEPAKYLSASDVFCLPSYREGFGLVIIEAAAVGIPSIGSNIYGISDTIDDGTTGFFFEMGAYHDLMLKMTRFVDDPSLIKTMGEKARVRALEKYPKEKITAAMLKYYKSLCRLS
ncbi:MAG TPA: glycosyltransferase family 4 protein [Syntrophorhabdaceae bacterium]|nr:glycosyltransferase family 4 protein [Syntrophorhabdaceae bacterium]